MIVLLIAVGLFRLFVFILTLMVALYAVFFLAMAWVLMVMVSFTIGIAKGVVRHAKAAH